MGPNDYHVDPDGDIQPGLGKDELTDEQRAAMRSKSGQAMLRMKEELDVQTAELTERERTAEAKELELARREAALVAREKAMETAAAKKSGGTAAT